MNKLTLEELLLQILSTVLLINAQGKWHAFYDLHGHTGTVDIWLLPSDHDYQSREATSNRPRLGAAFTSTNRHPTPVPEDLARKSLIELLAWTQSHLNMEAPV